MMEKLFLILGVFIGLSIAELDLNYQNCDETLVPRRLWSIIKWYIGRPNYIAVTEIRQSVNQKSLDFSETILKELHSGEFELLYNNFLKQNLNFIFFSRIIAPIYLS